jgi:sugar lactone lactonase YvrE
MALMGSEPELVWELAAELGEGPVWVERDRALWFVDIKKQLVHRYDPANGAKNSWKARGFRRRAAIGPLSFR